MASPRGILSGYRVLDCTVAMAGPFAAQRLGDLGADVIKIEPPGGEWQRHVPAGGQAARKINASFLSLNRNKRSLAVNLKSEEGRAVVQDLVRCADVFMQNYRPSVAERLGVDYKTLSAINPRLIYVSISGYGADGPYVDYPGQDLLVQAMSGSMYSIGRESEPPQPAGQYVVDATTAYCAFEGAVAALLHRERTGEGQLVEINMLDSAITFQMQELSVLTLTGRPQRRSAEPHAHVYIRAPYGVFKTADDYIALGFPPLAKLAEVLEEPRLSGMADNVDGFEKRDLIHRLVATRTRNAAGGGVARPYAQGRCLGSAGLRFRADDEGPAGDPQRDLRRVRPLDRRSAEDPRLSYSLRQDAGPCRARRAQRRRAFARYPVCRGLRYREDRRACSKRRRERRRVINQGGIEREETMKRLAGLFLALGFLIAGLGSAYADKGQIVYIVDTMGDPFWGYVALGIKDAVQQRGYDLAISDSKSSAQNQLQNAQDAVAKHVAGIVLSPTDSSTAPAVLDIAASANIPVSFAGIGTVSGKYVTYVTSDDEQGAHGAGAELVKALKAHGWKDGTIGMIQISQARQNGRLRTAGFEKAMKEGGYEVVAKNEMRLYTADETFKFAQDMLTAHPEMRGIFVEAANASLGALRAIQASRRADQTLLVAFDGLPQFVDLIKQGDLVASAMQQPYLMGFKAAESVIDSIEGKPTQQTIALPVLIVTKDNMDQMLPILEKTVFPKGSIK